MATVRILSRWLACVRDGVWEVVDGPPEIAVALNAIRPDDRQYDDLELARDARRLYPHLEVLAPNPTSRVS